MSSLRHYFNGCCFDASDGRLSNEHREDAVVLRPQAARLLERFIEQPGEVIDRESLCQAVWDEGRVVDFESGLGTLIRELRQALDEVGAGAELLETVPRRGYRFLGQLREFDASGAADAEHSDRKRVVWIILVLVAVILAGSLLAWFTRPSADAPVATAPTLAIIPFEVYNDNRVDRRLELLLADTVLARLWQADLQDLVLIGRATLRPYHGREDVAVAVAEDLGVDLLIEGTVVLEGAQDWRVDARLLSMPGGTVVWSATVIWSDRERLPVSETADQLVNDLAGAWVELLDRHDLVQISE